MSFGADITSFSVNIIGDKTGKQWVGDFKVKTLLSHRDDFMRDMKRREFLGPINPQLADAYTLNAAEAFGELSVRIVEAPAFWKESGGGLDLIDNNVVREIYNQAMAAEKAVLDKVKAEAEKSKEELRKDHLAQNPE